MVHGINTWYMVHGTVHDRFGSYVCVIPSYHQVREREEGKEGKEGRKEGRKLVVKLYVVCCEQVVHLKGNMTVSTYVQQDNRIRPWTRRHDDEEIDDQWINGWINGWMDRWIDGSMDQWINGWIDGRNVCVV